MKTFTINTPEDISRIAVTLESGGDSSEFDESGGCEHLREIADESGVQWFSHREHMQDFKLNGRECCSWYDEDRSCYRPWNVFSSGLGTFSGPCLTEALTDLLEKMQ